MSTRSVVVIGPPVAGKSTFSEVLSTRIKLPCCSIDAERDSVAPRFGFSSTRLSASCWTAVRLECAAYTNKFDSVVLEHWLTAAHPCVIDTSGALTLEAQRLIARLSVKNPVWVVIWPRGCGETQLWSHRLASRSEGREWWSRGGWALQDATIDAGRQLCTDSRVALVSGVEEVDRFFDVAG